MRFRERRLEDTRAHELAPERVDELLMARVRDGDRAAFAELVERWQPDLVRFFRLLGAVGHDVDDCVQDVFLRLYRFRSRYESRPGLRFRAYLLRMARNVYVDHLRRGRRRVSCVEIGAAESAAAKGARHDERLDLEAAIAGLSEKLRWALVLGVYEGLAYAEVADVLGVPVGTVKSRVHAAVAKLREVLDVRA